jgi:protein involved in polysaccharide export with SLBB domain
MHSRAAPTQRLGASVRRQITLIAAAAIAMGITGCAAITNPVANGVPVQLVPDELLGPSKENFLPVDLTLLRQSPPEEYILSPGDTLGVYVEGVLGDSDSAPPVSVPDSADVPPSIGYPFPIRSDGTISLPLVGAVKVDGLTIDAAERKVIDRYLEEEIVRRENYRVIVTLLRPRYERILVVREDADQAKVSVTSTGLVGFGSQTSISSGRSATGQVVELPAYENDVLNALARTGGLPGPEARQEVVIYRGSRTQDGRRRSPEELAMSCGPRFLDAMGDSGHVVRIPLETYPGMPLDVADEDIILHTGDIVTIRNREPELYYTGGLIPSGEYQLPYDRDMSVVEALLKSRAPLVSGGVSTSNLNGTIVTDGIGNPSPSLLSVIRKTPNGSQIVIRVDLNEALRDPRLNILVQAEDVLILQENTDEALSRYFSRQFQMDLFFRWLDRGDAVGTGTVVGP